MSQTIVIDPVTRIEGHSKITIQLDDRGEVVDAHFHVTQFRGFERLCQGRPVHEMPSLMARICGICPVSHLVASSKAVDDIMAVEPTPTGADLRRVINLGQIVQSNALSFFHLSSPDLLFGFDADPAKRNIVGVAQANPALARDGIALRKWGQQIIEWLGGKRIHPTGIVPGGVAFQLTAEVRDRILAGVPEAIARSVAARASGTPARIRSRTSGLSWNATPPGTMPSGWIRLPPSHSMICWPHFRSSMPSRASWGLARATPTMLRTAGSASNPNSRSGEQRWKKCSACDCITCP